MSFKRSSDTIAISFSTTESAPGTFTQEQINLSLNPLDNEIFVVLAVDLNVDSPDALAGTNTATRAGVSSTSLTAMGKLSDSNVLAVAQEAIRAAGFVDGGVGFSRTADESYTGMVDYIGIISTNNFFVQVQGANNLGTKEVAGRLWGYRATANAATYAALVQSEVLSA